MPSFSDSIVLFILALLLFGPKKLPVLARELGKWVGEFRRASNEFKMQMEEELRMSEQADRQKQIAAMEAAAPVQALPEPETIPMPAETSTSEPTTTTEPLPIAVSGDLSIMPPSTGLPTARNASSSDGLGSLIDAIPSVAPETLEAHPSMSPIEEHAHESAAHGD